MLKIDELKVSYGGIEAVKGISLEVPERKIVTLIDANGAGKSTMLKILCGLQQPTEGTVSAAQGTTIGYLPQVMVLTDDTTVREEARKAFAGNPALKERLARTEAELAGRTDY